MTDPTEAVASMHYSDDLVAAALAALTKANIPPDVQELLVYGDGRGTVAPNALRKMLKHLSSIGFGDTTEARRQAIEEAARVAENFPALTHGNLATAPVFAAEQAADEIAAAIRALAAPDETQKPRQP